VGPERAVLTRLAVIPHRDRVAHVNPQGSQEESCGLGQPQVTLMVPSPTSIGGGLLPSFAGCFCIGPSRYQLTSHICGLFRTYQLTRRLAPPIDRRRYGRRLRCRRSNLSPWCWWSMEIHD
jgi:hypothetical protein